MNLPKPAYIDYEALRVSKLLSGLVSCKMLTAVRFGANSSVYNAEMTILELTTAQSIILSLFYGLLSSDLKFCYILQELISKVDQLKSPYLSSWLRDDFKFNTSDVYKVISNLAYLVRGQHIALPDYILRVFASLNSKYDILDTCKTKKDLEGFYFLLSVNNQCSRSQQTEKTSVSNLISSFESNVMKKKNSMVIAQKPVLAPKPVLSPTNTQAVKNEDMLMDHGSTCPHFPLVGMVPNRLLQISSPCLNCSNQSENWICLTCYFVGCSRYVNKHMMMHNESTKHPLALSCSSHSVWCYPCRSYINQPIQWSSDSGTLSFRPENIVRYPIDGSNSLHTLASGGHHHGREPNHLIKEPNNDSDEGSDLFQRSRSSSISNQSLSSERSTYTDSKQGNVNSRNPARTRNKSRTRGRHFKENNNESGGIHSVGKPLTHAVSSPNISDLFCKKDEISPEASLLQSYLSKPGTAPISYSQISRLISRRDGKGGKSPLHQASKDGLLAVAKGLIKYGAPINCRDDVGFTPAHYAARGGYIELLEVLKQHEADLIAVGDSGDTLLHLAARKNHAGTCGWLLDNGVAIDAQGYKGRTALHCAAMWGYIETVRLLLMRKASVHIKDFYHNTAYDLAVSQGHPKVANMLKNVM
ncbi:unnamed protein product [Nezara viridula]|uniref:UBP-type domain-containing protein n=1 Tax=Nezara viridula TaxID=85310 RepID=A0A9P0E464_NEZVI|nr:unnamed protein product [Nezara viridula]